MTAAILPAEWPSPLDKTHVGQPGAARSFEPTGLAGSRHAALHWSAWEELSKRTNISLLLVHAPKREQDTCLKRMEAQKESGQLLEPCRC